MAGHLRVVPKPEIPLLDAEREARIHRITNEILRNKRLGTFGLKRAMELQEELRAEIAARSPEQVLRMEFERGLRR